MLPKNWQSVAIHTHHLCIFNSGGDLARIKSEEESSKIGIELKKFDTSYLLSQIWISLTNFEMDLQEGK